MPDLSLIAFLQAAGPAIAKGAGAVVGREAVRAWLRETRTTRAADRALDRTATRHRTWPGVDRALREWKSSPSFENLLLQIRLGQVEDIEEQIVRSFLDNAGSLGWHGETQGRAQVVTSTFWTAFVDELAMGDEGRALAIRLAAAEAELARGERARIQESSDEGRDAAIAGIGATQAVGEDLGGKMDELLRRFEEKDALPEPVRAALHRPVFDELTRLLTDGDPLAALDLADRSSEAIEAALADVDIQHADALRPYRQRLLFAAANAASWMGEREVARDRAQRAFGMGSVDSEQYPQAVQAAFNAALPDALRAILTTMPPDDEGRPRAESLLAFADEDWAGAAQRLAALDAAGLVGLRAEAEAHAADVSDPDRVATAADVLDAAEEVASTFIDDVALARSSALLLSRVVDGQTPLDLDRRPLADAVLVRALRAVDRAAAGSHLRAIAVAALGDASRILYDGPLLGRFEEEVDALPEPTRSRVFVPLDGELTVDAVEAQRREGRLDDAQAAILTARVLRESDPDRAEQGLREALFQTVASDDRAAILGELIDLLRAHERDVDADGLLAQTPIPDADRWFLAQRTGSPLDVEGAEKHTLDVRVLRYVATRLTRETDEWTDGSEPLAMDDPARPSAWTRRLVRVLPSRSSFLSHAEALLHDGHFDNAAEAARDLDAVYAGRAAEIEAFALQGLGRPQEAARVLTGAAKTLPDSERLAINASAVLLSLGKADEAAAVLEPHVTDETKTVGVLANYAAALLARAPGDVRAASQAFDLLRRAHEVSPSRGLAMQVWKAGHAAHRGAEASDYFRRAADGVRRVHIETIDDATRALAEGSTDEITAFTGDFSLFAEAIRPGIEQAREAADAVDRFSSSHGLAYVDTFRAAGHSWENWTRWTEAARARGDTDGYGILADWPSSVFVFGRAADREGQGLYADPTALLTLGLLGPETAWALLQAAGPVRIERGTLDGLLDELGRLQNDILLGAPAASSGTFERFRGTDAVVPYDEALEAQAPDDPTLGAARVDVGAAVLLGGRYVTDSSTDLGDEAQGVTLRSASLLATLNLEGLVSKEDADRMAVDFPSVFGEWDEAPALDGVPAALVFDPFALAAWVETGLVEAVADAVRVGPWAWTQVASGAKGRSTATLSYDRLRQTVEVLHAAALEGLVVEVDAAEAPDPDEPGTDDEEPDTKGIEAVWEGALRSVRTAQAHGLQLWADDRFYPLLLWMGGPTLVGPSTEAVRAPLAERVEETLPTPTVDLVARLARDGAVSDGLAREIAGLLFDYGYRPLHPLVLADAVRQFGLPENGPLRGRFAALAASITEIPKYLPDTIEPARRQGFARVAAAELTERLVVTAWRLPDLSTPQRRLLADAFLEAVETVFREQSPSPDRPRGDRTRLQFWRSLSSTLFTGPFDDDRERQDEALRWLGDAASRRPDPHHDIVRLLEDNASSAVTLTPGVEEIEAVLAKREPSGDPVDPVQAKADAVGRIAFRALVPLVSSRLVDRLDPLLRRTVGLLAGLERGGRIDTVYGFQRDGQELTVTIPEEDDEAAAINLIRRVLHGDAALADSVRATDLAFIYNRLPPDDWVEAGVPADAVHPVDVEVSLLTLLWGDEADVFPAVIALLIHHLSLLDPPLSLRLADLADDLTSGDEVRVEKAKNALALDLLTSGHYELQRDLGHAVWRLRNWPAKRLARFLGWIGNADAQRLVEADAVSADHLVVLGDVVVSQGHFYGRQLLTARFRDAEAVLDAVAATERGEENPPISDVPQWLASRVEAAETANDPFVAAYALLHTLLALRVAPSYASDSPSAEDTAERLKRYLLSALADPKQDGAATALDDHTALRRRLARASMQLAAFACFGEKHLEAYGAEDDPLAEWLDKTWLLTSRFISALPALFGDLERATVEAEQAAYDLGLDLPTALVEDTFDPFTLTSTSDLGRTLTLYAMATALDETASMPPWWTTEVADQVAAIAAQDPPGREVDAKSLGDRLGVGRPLRERDLAREILRGASGEPTDGAR
ncbi:MAG: hypothetical protein CMM85_17805 [Rhodothermaceae bacterium]|nr:hypothetical protein [Rhodothermaceae bacterium]